MKPLKSICLQTKAYYLDSSNIFIISSKPPLSSICIQIYGLILFSWHSLVFKQHLNKMLAAVELSLYMVVILFIYSIH